MEAHYYLEYSRMEREHWWFEGRRQILGSVIDRLTGARRRPRILDLGCGTGESSRHLAQFGRVTSVDLSELALGFCRHKALPRLVRGDAVHLPFAEGAFDLVCGLDILEHLADEERALAEMVRVCRPGGQVLVTVPALPILWSRHDIVNHHQRRYRKGQLRDAVARSGLRPGILTYFNTFLLPPTLLVRLGSRLVSRPAPPSETHSDLACSTGGVFSGLLRRVFAMERGLVGRIPLPLGVSLLCVAKKPGETCPAETEVAAHRRSWADSILDRFVRPPRPLTDTR